MVLWFQHNIAISSATPQNLLCLIIMYLLQSYNILHNNVGVSNKGPNISFSRRNALSKISFLNFIFQTHLITSSKSYHSMNQRGNASTDTQRMTAVLPLYY